MLKNSLYFAKTGKTISSGDLSESAILNTIVSECINDDEDISPHSFCATQEDVTIWTLNSLESSMYDRVVLRRNIDNARITPKELFLKETKRLDKNRIKVKLFDWTWYEMSSDASYILKSLDQWPYKLIDFLKIICPSFLNIINTSIPNENFPVYKFDFEKKKYTFQDVIGFVCDICCRFPIYTGGISGAYNQRDVEMKWYEPVDVKLYPAGDNFYYSGSTFSDFDVKAISGVHVLIKDDETGERLYPEVPGTDEENLYTITDNPLIDSFISNVGEEMLDPYLESIKKEMEGLEYTPCKLLVPARADIEPGKIFHFVDYAGKTHKAICMKKTTKGSNSTIECTGNPMRKQYYNI